MSLLLEPHVAPGPPGELERRGHRNRKGSRARQIHVQQLPTRERHAVKALEQTGSDAGLGGSGDEVLRAQSAVG